MIADLAEQSAEGTDEERLADLAHQALALAAFVPDFELEPRLLTTLKQYLAVVTADLRATGLDGPVRLVVEGGADPPHAYVQYKSSFGHTSGLAPSDGDGSDPLAALVLVADELQDAVMDSLMAAWPVCPRHNLGAHARAIDGEAVWWCKGGTGHDISVIGKWDG